MQEQLAYLNEELDTYKKNEYFAKSHEEKDEIIKGLQQELQKETEKQKKMKQDPSFKENFEKTSENEAQTKLKLLESSLSTKDQEIITLNNEIKQRDILLEKARNLVITLNEECNRKTISLKNSDINEFTLTEISPSLLKENEKLRESIQTLKKRISELEFEGSKKEEFTNSKRSSFNLEIDDFSPNAKKKSLNSQIENDIFYLESELTEVNNKLRDINSENIRLNDYISALETKYSNLVKEKEQIAENLIKVCEKSEQLNYKNSLLEVELKKLSEDFKPSPSVEDLSKLLVQKESVIADLTSQIQNKTHKHKKHRHSSRSKDIYELVDAIKQEISNEKNNTFELSRENFSCFKDFQAWYKKYSSEKKSQFFEEILVFLLECFKGKNKENIKKLLENIRNIENESLYKQVLGYIKSASSGKAEIDSLLRELNQNLNLGLESISLVIQRLREIKRNISIEPNSDLSLKVVDLTLGFLKNFSKEREIDYELSCEMIKIISNV